MEVEVRLFAGLRAGRFSKQPMELPEGAGLRAVLQALEIAEDEVSLPLINGQYSNLDDELSPGDVISLFPAVGGG